jgi:hypothetical protein
MAENAIRTGTQKEEKKNLFSAIGKVGGVDRLFEEGVPVHYLPYVLYVVGLLIFYIGNSHNAERTIRKIDKLKTEVSDLRADYTTLKADLMIKSKQSEVAKQVGGLLLEESIQPPYLIVLKKSEY